MLYEIIPQYGHYVVYLEGKFFCTADSRKEAEREIEEYLERR